MESLVVEVDCVGNGGIVGAVRIVDGSVGSCVDEVAVCGGPKIESKKSKSGNDVVDVIFEDVIIDVDVGLCCFTFGIFGITSG